MDRRTVVAFGVLSGSIGVLTVYLAIWAGLPSLYARGSDFSASYVAGQLWLDHPYGNLYNQNLEASAHQLLLPAGAIANLPFVSPPLAAVLAAPFTWLNLDIAYRLFSLLQLGLVAAACAIAAWFAPWPQHCPALIKVASVFAATAGVGTAAMFWLGQWDGVIALTLAVGYGALRVGKGGKAGAWLTAGLALVKPHLAMGIAGAALGLRGLHFIVGAFLTALGIAAITVVAVGPSTAYNFVGALFFESGHTPPASTLGIYGMMSSWPTTKPLFTFVITATLGVLLLCFALGHNLRQEPELALAGTLALTLVASPHTLPHDLVLLAPIFVALVAKLMSSKGLGIAMVFWALLNVATLFDLGNSTVGPPGRLVPWVLLGIGIASYVSITRLRAPRPARLRQPE